MSRMFLVVLMMVAAFDAAAVDGTFVGKDSVSIAYRIAHAPFPRAGVLLLQGYSDTYLIYDELIKDLNEAGYTVYTHDHRGMGLSERLIANRQKIHVESFLDYIADTEAFVDTIVRRDSDLPLMVIGHSTGGLVATLLAARRPELFQRAVLNAPLFWMNTGKLPHAVAYSVVASANAMGLGESYAMGFADSTPEQWSFATNKRTHDRGRFENMMTTYTTHPELWQSGATNRWVKTAMDATGTLKKVAPQFAVDTLILQAGDDAFVDPRGHDRFCAAAPACRLVRFEGSFHEIFREQNGTRDRWLAEVLFHLSRNDSAGILKALPL